MRRANRQHRSAREGGCAQDPGFTARSGATTRNEGRGQRRGGPAVLSSLADRIRAVIGTTNPVARIPDESQIPNPESRIPDESRIPNPESLVPGESRIPNPESRVPGESRIPNPESRVPGESRIPSPESRVPGESRIPNPESRVPGESRIPSPESRVPGESRIPSPESRVPGESRIPNPESLDLSTLGGEWRANCFVVERRLNAAARHGREVVGTLAQLLDETSSEARMFTAGAPAPPPLMFF